MSFDPTLRPRSVPRSRDVLGPASPLGGLLSGYEDRPGQLEMAEAVEEALASRRPLFVEAGTGTGKTLAYLVPAVLSGAKVVVSTATKNLEEQIFDKDLPLVARLLERYGVRFQAALMKGMSNYVCRRRFAELRARGDLDMSLRKHLPIVEPWVENSEFGDRSELAVLPDDAPIWREMNASPDTRLGSECSFYEECFVTKMRRDAEAANVVVVNHHLFLADLALRTNRGGDYASAIPNYDAVIFDEAHQLEDIATEFFGVKISIGKVDALVRDAYRTLLGRSKPAKNAPVPGELPALGNENAARDEAAVRALEHATERAFERFAVAFRRAESPGGANAREPRRVVRTKDFDGETRAAIRSFDEALGLVRMRAEMRAEDDGAAVIARRSGEISGDLREICAAVDVDPRSEVPFDEPHVELDPEVERERDDDRVVWIESRDRNVGIGSSPITLGPILRHRLFDRVGAVVCTSATLATWTAKSGPSFHYARARIGAPGETRELVVPSPFDFASRSLLYLPRDLPEPQSPDFEERAMDRIRELVGITKGGAFVLTTSNRMMNRFHVLAKDTLPYTVLVQGEAPKHALLQKFRSAGDAVLVATMGFWEGVDVPGHALRLVILDKIPFAVPTDPIVRARRELIEREGGDAFTEYQVPAAAIALKQGFGRLIRTRKDAGIVAILDRRIVEKGYGKRLLADLPPARRTSSQDDVAAFWDRILFGPPGEGRDETASDGRI
ncbi:MAG: ATP-dependent DNA helicase [Polyangiaceae bacterium]